MSLSARTLSVLRFRLREPHVRTDVQDLWTDPSTTISCAPSNSQYPTPQLLIKSKSVGAQNIQSGCLVGNRNAEGFIVFHGNRLCHLIMTVDPDCADLVDALLAESDRVKTQ